MKSPYISELQPNQIVTSVFLVQHKDVRQKKTGDPYLSLILSDRTGELEAKMWDNVADVMDTFERDDFLKVRGLLQVFQNRLQLTIHRLQRQSESEIDVTDYFPASKRNPEEMMNELLGIVRGIGNPDLRTLVLALLEDPQIAARYKLAPAAKNIHHAYLGGLIEHVLSLCGLARLTAAHYPNIDLDLLLAGVVLHDIGKVEELTYDRSFGYSSSGQLLGHIVIALRMIDEKLRGIPQFPSRLRTLIEHMVISHHGELEYGSPKVPVFPEALLLHHLDNLDSKMECMRAFIEKDRHVEGCWTSYSNSLERPVLKKSLFLSESAQPDRRDDGGSTRAAAASGHMRWAPPPPSGGPKPEPAVAADAGHTIATPRPPVPAENLPAAAAARVSQPSESPEKPAAAAQGAAAYSVTATPAARPVPQPPLPVQPFTARPYEPGPPHGASRPVPAVPAPVGVRPAHPAAPQVPARPAGFSSAPRPHTPSTPSLFGEKLMGALQDDKENS